MPPLRERHTTESYQLHTFFGLASEVLSYDRKKQPCGYEFSFIEEGESDGRFFLEISSINPISIDDYNLLVDSIKIFDHKDGNVEGGTESDGHTGATTERVIISGEPQYIVSDGGPHLFLPDELREKWHGVTNLTNPTDPDTDYGRACSAATPEEVSLIDVAQGNALVIGGSPEMTASEVFSGGVYLYLLSAWQDSDINSLIQNARDYTAKSECGNTGIILELQTDGMTHMYAGDAPGQSVYGEVRLSVPRGKYRVLRNSYSPTPAKSVLVFRLIAM